MCPLLHCGAFCTWSSLFAPSINFCIYVASATALQTNTKYQNAIVFPLLRSDVHPCFCFVLLSIVPNTFCNHAWQCTRQPQATRVCKLRESALREIVACGSMVGGAQIIYSRGGGGGAGNVGSQRIYSVPVWDVCSERIYIYIACLRCLQPTDILVRRIGVCGRQAISAVSVLTLANIVLK